MFGCSLATSAEEGNSMISRKRSDELGIPEKPSRRTALSGLKWPRASEIHWYRYSRRHMHKANTCSRPASVVCGVVVGGRRVYWSM